MNDTNLLYLRTYIKMSNEELIEAEASGKLADALIENNGSTILQEINQISVEEDLNDYVSQIKGILMFYYCGDYVMNKVLPRINKVLEDDPFVPLFFAYNHKTHLKLVIKVKNSLQHSHFELKKCLEDLIYELEQYCKKKNASNEKEQIWINSFIISLFELHAIHFDEYDSYKELVDKLYFPLMTDADIEILRNNKEIDYTNILPKRDDAKNKERHYHTSGSYSSDEDYTSQGYFPPSGYGPEAIYNP